MFNSYVLFENKGEIDIDALKFMGCSTKNGTDTIGKFGTGLKYAIAVLLRNKVEIEIFSGRKQIKLTKKEKIISGKKFDVVLIDGEETGITTSLGREWKLWQAVREFYANCLDEGGNKKTWHWTRKGKDNTTRIFIKYSDIETTFEYFKFDGWNKIDKGLFYIKKKNKSPLKVFKEGFLVFMGDKSQESLYDFRIDFIGINEARLIENTWDMKFYIGSIIKKMDYYSVNQIIDSGDYKFSNDFDNLGEGWQQAQIARGGDLYTDNPDLNNALKKLKTKTDKKFRYGGGYYSDSVSIIIIEELGEIVIGTEQYKLYISAFEDQKQKFDFDLSKNEIHINTKFKHEQQKLLMVISELVENNRIDRKEFIVQLLERIYSVK